MFYRGSIISGNQKKKSERTIARQFEVMVMLRLKQTTNCLRKHVVRKKIVSIKDLKFARV